MKKPLIGISCHTIPFTESWFHGYDINYIGQDEAISVMDAGGIPMVLPQTSDDNIIKEYLDRVDGLVIIGGEDISPSLYNEDMLEKCAAPNYDRDVYDSKLILEAFRLKKPLIVICRGLQLTNVLLGGTLYQDLSYNSEISIDHVRMADAIGVVHDIEVVDKDSLFYKALKRDTMYVNSIHHQMIKDLAPSLKVVAKSVDNVVEVAELKTDDHFFVGTQFHPEMMSYRNDKEMINLFKAFVAASM